MVGERGLEPPRIATLDPKEIALWGDHRFPSRQANGAVLPMKGEHEKRGTTRLTPYSRIIARIGDTCAKQSNNCAINDNSFPCRVLYLPAALGVR